MTKHESRSRVAFALSVGVAVSLVLLAAGILWSIADSRQELTSEASTLASAVLGGAVGALATYLGQGDSKPHEHEPEPLPWSDEEQRPPADDGEFKP